MIAQENSPRIKPIIGRVGGKARLAPWILDFIKQHHFSIYCEPFAGSAAVYFALLNDGIPAQIRKRGHHPRFVLNDADSRIVNLFRTCRDHPEMLAYAVRMTPYSREEHRIAQQDLDELEDEIEQARRALVDCWQSFKYEAGDSWGVQRYLEFDQFKEGLGSWQFLPSRILNATDALKSCYIENDDAVKCIERWSSPHTLFYCDPPYVDCEAYYAHNASQSKDANRELHFRLAEIANTVEAAGVLVSYYPNDLLEELYPEDRWERHYKETVASAAGVTRTSKTRTRPKRTELLLVRKRQGDAPKVALSGQISLF